MKGKQRGEGRMEDDRKAGKRRQNGNDRNGEEKEELRMIGKQRGESRMKDNRKAGKRRQNEG